jgi:hypothetical protein
VSALLQGLSWGIASGQPQRIEIQFGDGQLSADIQQATLSDIFDKLKREKGIWVKGAEGFSQEEVTVQFPSLPIEEGIGRILAGMNYSLAFDQDNRLIGIILMGKSTDAGTPAMRGTPHSARPRTR